MRLVFFDIDETLFETYAKINVIKDGNIIKQLSNKEYNTYTLKDGEYFEYSEFKSSSLFKQSKPINNIINSLKDMYNRGCEISLLTARSDFDDKDSIIDFFNSYGINVGHYKDKKIHIIRCGNEPGAPAQRKYDVINNILKKRLDIKEIVVIDDSTTNLSAISKINISKKLYKVIDNKMIEFI